MVRRHETTEKKTCRPDEAGHGAVKWSDRLLGSPRLPGCLILVAMLAGLGAANSPLKPFYDYIHHATVHLGIGSLTFGEPLIVWINEGLMVFFFLLVTRPVDADKVEWHNGHDARNAWASRRDKNEASGSGARPQYHLTTVHFLPSPVVCHTRPPEPERSMA